MPTHYNLEDPAVLVAPDGFVGLDRASWIGATARQPLIVRENPIQ
jgi:hypothetical protein